MNVDILPPFTPIPARPANPLQPEQPPAAPKKPRKKKEEGRFKPGAKTALDVVREAPAKAGKAKKAAKKPAKAPKKGKAYRQQEAELAKAGALQMANKRTRSSRVAPLMLDAAQALTALAGLGKTEVTTMRAIIELLNPLARPARKRVLSAVLALMGA